MSTAASQPPSHEITPESVFHNRRQFLKNGALAAGTAVAVGSGLLWLVGQAPPPDAPPEQPAVQAAESQAPVQAVVPAVSGKYTVDEPLTSQQSVTTYNNYYEFGLDKGDPAQNDHRRRRGRQAPGHRHRHAVAVVPARRAGLSDALRRGLVDGHSLA